MSLTKPNTLGKLIARWIAYRPWLSFAIGSMLMLGLSAGLSNLRMETDYQIFFAPESKEVKRFNHFQSNFGREDTLYFSLTAPAGETLFKEERLRVIGLFSDEAKNLPYVRKVASIANFPLVDANDIDISISPPYYVNEKQEGIEQIYPIAEMQQRILKEPSAKYKLLSEDGASTGVLVMLSLPQDTRSASAKEVHDSAKQLIEKYKEAFPELSYRMTGSIALDGAFGEANAFDLSVLFPAAITLIVLVSALIFKSIILYISLSIVVTAATLACLGFSGWTNIPLSSVSITSPVIVVIIAIAELMHFVVAWQQKLGGENADKKENVASAIEKVIIPAFLTSVTTIAGFMTLTFSATPPFQHLGLIASFGVVMAFIFTFSLGCPLFTLVTAKSSSGNKLNRLAGFVAKLAVGSKGVKISTGLSALMLIIVAGISLNKIDDNYVHYFGKSFEFRQHSDFIDHHLTGIYSLEYSIASRGLDVYDKDYLQALKDFSEWALKQQGVRSVDTLEDVIAQVHRAFNNGDDKYRFAPEDNDLTTQYGVLYEMSVPKDFDFSNRVSANGKESRVTVYLSNLSISQIASLEKRANKYLQDHVYFSEGSALERRYEATGTSIIFSHIGLNNIHDMLGGTVALFLMASLLMWMIFRSPVVTTLASLANIVPALVTLGIWGILVGRIGMGSAAVVTVTLGLVIDDTIHLGYRYLNLRKAGQSAEEAIRNAIIGVGPAIIFTTCVLVFGFSIVALSAFEINAAIGKMIAVTVVIALVFDLLILPSVLIKFDQRKLFSEKRSVSHVNEAV